MSLCSYNGCRALLLIHLLIHSLITRFPPQRLGRVQQILHRRPHHEYEGSLLLQNERMGMLSWHAYQSAVLKCIRF